MRRNHSNNEKDEKKNKKKRRREIRWIIWNKSAERLIVENRAPDKRGEGTEDNSKMIFLIS